MAEGEIPSDSVSDETHQSNSLKIIPTLKILSNELSEITDWHSLGVKLGVRPGQLCKIEANHTTVDRKKHELLALWLGNNPNPSWEEIVRVLQQMGEDTVATRIKQKYVHTDLTGSSHSADRHFVEGNLSQIQGKFAKLLRFVRRKLRENLKEKRIRNELRLFVLDVLSAVKCTLKSLDVEDIFEYLSTNRLWDFWNYHLLEQIIDEFGSNDSEMVEKMKQYKKDLSGYKTANKLAKHIATLSKILTSDDYTSSDPPNEEYFRELSVKLEERVAEYTLDYLDKLWDSLQTHLLLPPLGFLLRTIHKGCICITWLIPADLTRKIIERARRNVTCFQQYPILKVTVDSECVYERKPTNPEAITNISGRKDCVKYKLSGRCEQDNCIFNHQKASETFRTVIKLPQGLLLVVALEIIKHMRLKDLIGAVELLLLFETEGQIEIVAAEEDQLSEASEKLRALFTLDHPPRPKWCYIHTEGITEAIAGKMLLEFNEYQGRAPTRHSRGRYHNAVYEVCCCENTETTLSCDSSLEELKKLNSTSRSSPIELRTVLDMIFSSPSKTAEAVVPIARLTSCVMTEYKEDIKSHLQDALEWARENQAPSYIVKLQARFGKLLWLKLPKDAFDNPWDIEKFVKFLFTDNIHSQVFNTDVKRENAEHLGEEISTFDSILKTFDIKFSTILAGYSRQKLDLRLKVKGGKLEIVLLKRNETKVVAFDILCLHRQHDIRISLNCLEIVPETHQLYGIANRLLQSLTLLKPGTLEFIPCANDWNVEFIRHKKRTAYVIDDKYMVAITAIQEYRTDWEKLAKGQAVTVNFDHLAEHSEVEFRNILWECTFGKDIDFPPEKALALHTEHPAVTPQLAASIPHPWGVQDILQDYDEFLDYLDQLNESLGMVVA